MSFGETLRVARERLGKSEKDVADILRVSTRVIEAFEREDIEKLPPRVYSRGVLKKYAEHLGFSADAILDEFDILYAKAHPVAARADSVEKRPPIFMVLLGQRRFALFSFFIVILIVGAYFSYAFRYVLREPRLVVSAPGEDITTDARRITVSGIAEEGTDVMLNGRELSVNEEREFSEEVFLREGLNVLEFEARDRFGKTRTVTRYVFVK